jgi:hypothetical protein
MGLAMRFLLGLLLGVGVSSAIAFGLGFSKQVPLETAPFLFYMFAIFIAPLSVVGVLYFTRFRHFIGYTGEKGVAHYRISGSRENVKSAGQFLFQDADYLRVSITDHYYNGGYNGTTFQYDWTDDNNDRIFRFKGTHYHAHKTPPRTSQHLFALAAEEAWSMYLLDMVVTEIQAGRAYTFLLSGEDGICCHKDFVELHQHKGVQRFYPGDLAEVAIKQGVITLKEPNAKEGWFTSTGVHSFSFAQLANAQVFLMLLTRLYGVASNW